jgi:hypothetical protein
MNDLVDLYRLAERRGIGVYWYTLDSAESLSVALPDGSSAIAMDPWHLDTLADEKEKLAHELGHCETGSFYSQSAALDVRQKHENRADRWAIQQLIPESALDQAVADGFTELWQLADYFNVTPDFMKKAVCLYTYGNLAVEQYFGA